MIISYNGKTQTIEEWAAEIGLKKDALYKRLRKMSVEEALSMPPMEPLRSHLPGHEGEHTVEEWMQITGLTKNAVYGRIYRAMQRAEKQAMQSKRQNRKKKGKKENRMEWGIDYGKKQAEETLRMMGGINDKR